MSAHPSEPAEGVNASKRCRATRSDGEPCRNPPIRGGAVCRYHGGSIGRVKAKAERRVAEAKALRQLARLGIDAPDEVAPSEALHEALRGAVGDYRAARLAVAEVPLDGDSLPAMVAVYERSADRLAKVARSALDAGLAERMASVAEADALALRDALDRATAAIGLNLEQRMQLGQALATELRTHKLQQIEAGKVTA